MNVSFPYELIMTIAAFKKQNLNNQPHRFQINLFLHCTFQSLDKSSFWVKYFAASSSPACLLRSIQCCARRIDICSCSTFPTKISFGRDSGRQCAWRVIRASQIKNSQLARSYCITFFGCNDESLCCIRHGPTRAGR